MYYMVFFTDDTIQILQTLEGVELNVPKQELGEFIDMLLEAQELLNLNTQRSIDICRRLSWLKNNGVVFESELVEMGLVIPIQKQATISGSDGR